jgi:hypothetical protein
MNEAIEKERATIRSVPISEIYHGRRLLKDMTMLRVSHRVY